MVAETHLSNPWKNLEGVKVGTIFTKWGNSDKNLLNGVITVKIVKLGGKNWNLLFINFSHIFLYYLSYMQLR
jgi:hypothetical protein